MRAITFNLVAVRHLRSTTDSDTHYNGSNVLINVVYISLMLALLG